ncbi:MAG: NAD-dependent succinate-semialdehyde dehydrogenase [Burkholderiaceae bacterium]
MKTIDPSDGRLIKTYPLMSADELEQVVTNCHLAFGDWKRRDPAGRAGVIRQIGAALRDNKESLARLMTREMGKLLQQSRDEIDLCAAICDWTADNGPDQLAPQSHESPDGKRGLIIRAPIGVVYGIQPWNYPAYQVIRYAIANLMAGNGVLLKHAESVTGTGQRLQELLLDAGLPPGLFAALLIDHEQSDAVIDHPLVRGVTLTGSPAAGASVGARAAGKLKKTVLELGSNDAYLVLEDADLPLAVKVCVQGRIYNNGETCIAAKRFVVVDKIYEDFKAAFVQQMRQLKPGDPTEPGHDLGPMARQDLRDTLHAQVTKSIALGAELLCGGEMPQGPGFYYPATVLANVSPGQPAYDDELFGPVASLIRALDEQDALRIANDSRFGLGGGIISRDPERAIELASQHFDTGMVFINAFGLASPDMPFGGTKQSGYGREHGGFGMLEFVNTKAISVAVPD